MRIECVGFEVEPRSLPKRVTGADLEWLGGIIRAERRSWGSWVRWDGAVSAVLYARYLIGGPWHFFSDGRIDRRGVFN